MNPILARIKYHKETGQGGIVSVCSAHQDVIVAAANLAQEYQDILLIESTSNQVDQFGGYTNMVPAEFVEYVQHLLKPIGAVADKVILGGDHLGPNAWQHLLAEEAMNHADELIRCYVAAGYQKIHLDCSMSCADDPPILDDKTVAIRAARLCKIAEETVKSSHQPHEIVYIIGTEVPVPGGAQEALTVVTPTPPQAARNTYDIHHDTFVAQGLSDAWSRVIGLVVQPGVEFDHHAVIDYRPESAVELSALADNFSTTIFEAHSTDYQKKQTFKYLVRDHFAILKVGPALTFALREAYFAFDDIAKILFPGTPSLRQKLEEVMLDKPQYWQKYYEGDANEQRLARAYSLSDRCRYYWSDERLIEAVAVLKTAFADKIIPLGLLKQFLPIAYEAIREVQINSSFDALVHFHIQQALSPYYQATAIDGV
ncbi:MAG: class II D-tagatose-bisphosphate aldolase non-catalytic subunit [Ostreibacterium sp.]